MISKKDAIILSAFTGFLLVDDFDDVQRFCSDLLGRDLYTHEMGRGKVFDEIHEKVKPLALALCPCDKPEPLTVDELREINGDKIQIRYIGDLKDFYDDEVAPYFGKYEQYIQEHNGMLRTFDLPLTWYGKEWLAYRYLE